MKDEVKPGTERDLVERTKGFALEVIMFYSTLPSTTVCQVLGRQLLRSALRSAPTIERPNELSPAQISLARLKAHFKNSMKLAIGWSYSKNREMRMQVQSSSC